MAPSYSNLPSSPTSTSRSPSYPPSRLPHQAASRPSSSSLSSSSFPSSSSSRSLPHRQNSNREMDAAFDDSGSDEDEEGDENVPLARSIPAAASATGGRGGGGGGATVVWSVDENREEQQAEIRQPTPSRTGAGLQDPLTSVGSGETRALGGGDGNLIGMDADERAGGYDFDRDYFLPPPGSPPPGAYPEAYLPSGPTPLTTTPAYPRAPSASTRFIRSILPTHFTRSAAPPTPRGSDGVFANIMAKPEVEGTGGGGEGNREGGAGSDGENGAVMAEFTQKEGPPSYNVALRDAVPAYWEHNVVAPQLGPLGSFSGSGDDLLLDGLPIGNFFGFAWNLLVSLSFQFVGFLLTYVLHTTHAAKYGSRAGLGITLIQYGLYLRTRGQEIMDSGLDPDVGATNDSFGAGAGGWWGMSDENGVPSGGLATTTVAVVAPTPTATAALAVPTFASIEEADAWAVAHNTTIWEAMGDSNRMQVGEANEWLSFVLMSCGWFILLTSLGGYWRVKRFERSLLISQQTDSSPSTSNTNAESSSSTSINPTRSWFTPPGASSSSPDDDDGHPITTARGEGRPNVFQTMGRSVRGIAAGVRERMDVMRGGGGRGGRRREGEEEEELMLE